MYYVYDKWNLFGFRCINEKKCATPECDYGRYVTSAGRCPRRNELRPRSWESQLGSIFPSICVCAKCQQNNFLYRLFIHWFLIMFLTATISSSRHRPRNDESLQLMMMCLASYFPFFHQQTNPVSFRYHFYYTPTLARLIRVSNFTILLFRDRVLCNLHTTTTPRKLFRKTTTQEIIKQINNMESIKMYGQMGEIVASPVPTPPPQYMIGYCAEEDKRVKLLCIINSNE